MHIYKYIYIQIHTQTHCNTLTPVVVLAASYSTSYSSLPSRPIHTPQIGDDIYIHIYMYTDTHTNSLQHFGASCGARIFILKSIYYILIHTQTHCNTLAQLAVLVASSYSTPYNTLPSRPIQTPHIGDDVYIHIHIYIHIYIYIYTYVYRYTHKLTATLGRQLRCSHVHTLLHT